MLNNIFHLNFKFSIWLFLNIIILIYSLYLRYLDPDGAIIFAYIMYIISFPLGFIVPFVFVCIDKCIKYDINIFYRNFPILVDIIIPWFLFVIVGYIQWFVIFPKIYAFLKNYKDKK